MEKLETLLDDIERWLQDQVGDIWNRESAPERLEALVKAAEALSHKLIEIGDSATPLLKGESHKVAQLIHYDWPERAKAFLLLWRDVIFQLQKAEILHRDGDLAKKLLARLWEESARSLREAAREFSSFLNRRLLEEETDPREMEKLRRLWDLQKDPWAVYREQLAKIPVQCLDLFNHYHLLLGVTDQFAELRQLIWKTLDACEEETQRLRMLAQQTATFIEETLDETGTPKPNKIVPRLEEVEAAVFLPDHLAVYMDAQEVFAQKLPETVRIPIETAGGQILYEEFNIHRKVVQWLESKMRPILMEVWEQTQLVVNRLKIALVNIRNRSLLVSAEFKTTDKEGISLKDLCQPLHLFLRRAEEQEAIFDKNRELATRRLNAGFRMEALYHPQKQFLPIPLQTTLRQIKFNENPLIARLQNWREQLVAWIDRFLSRVEREEALSQSEKVVRLIQSRGANRSENPYAGIFLTKGYIGESFLIGRRLELRRMETLIENWKGGFRGAVLLTGQRFSGKTLFGDWMSHRFFEENTVRLCPNTTIHLAGRRQKVSYRLEEGLSFIRKYSLNRPQLVWIDDLELWWDGNTPLSQNVRTLQKYINQGGTSGFYLVSMSNWLKTHLDRYYDLNKVFQAEINLDRMSGEEVMESILVRHGATHKLLVDEDGNEVGSQQFTKMVDKVYRASKGNIGEALRGWARHTRKLDEDRVVHQFNSPYNLPDFLNPENELILTTLMMKKRANEYHLRKLFGPAFKEKYSHLIQQLISIGLLTRQVDGWLEVNELVVNDVGRLLGQRNVLAFQR
jgi:hypothetical protein